MKLKALSVKGIGPFEKNTTFNIPKGLSIIYGLNRSSGKNSKNSNWCGKSLFFSNISELLYDEPIVGSKQDKIKSGSASLLLEHEDGRKLQVTRQENKLTVKIDGEDQEAFTKTKAQQLVKSFWPLSKEEYETFVHIDSRIPHPLVMGSTAERKNFFTSFFGLDKVDVERKLYLSELRKLDKTKEAYDELRATYSLLKRDALPRAELARMEEEREELQREFEQLRKETVKAQEKQRLLDSIKSIEENKEKLETKFHIFSMEQLLEKAQQYKQQIRATENLKQNSLLLSLYYKQVEKYNEALSSLPSFCKQISWEKAKIGGERYRNVAYELKQLEKQAQKKGAELTAVAKQCDEKPLIPKSTQTLGELLAQKEQLEHKISHARTFKSGTCPTCGQKVDKVDIDSLTQQLNTSKTLIEAFRAWDEYEGIVTHCSKVRNEYRAIMEEIGVLEENKKKYLKYYKAYTLLKDLPREPEKPSFLEDDPEAEENLKDVEYYEGKISTLQKRLSFLAFMKPYLPTIEAYNELEDKTYPQVDFSRVNSLSDRIAVLKTKIQLGTQTADKLHEVKIKLLAMREKLKNREPLEHLVEMYADKQLKKRIVQIIGTRLMSLVNKYARQIFNEDYKFELIWDTQIQIICTRKAGGNELVSDVRKLSGAESKLFTIILVLSLLSFVPSNRRPNVMILDEPTANFSSETTKCFQDLLQILSNLIESIIVITPRSEDIYPQARCFTVLREGTSKIVEGHPDSLELNSLELNSLELNSLELNSLELNSLELTKA